MLTVMQNSPERDTVISNLQAGANSLRKELKINFREIFRVVRFSTFATLSRRKRKFTAAGGTSEKYQFRTHAPQQSVICLPLDGCGNLTGSAPALCSGLG
jgi:hypothetical protein